jgi:hypothetical protein
VQAESSYEYLRRAPVTSGDPMEDRLSAFTDRTAAWFRSHPEYLSDSRQNSRVQAAHHFAVADGLTPDTDEYFAHCEKTLNLRGGNGNRGNGRSSGGGMRGGMSDIVPSDPRTHVQGNRVYLTENEKRIAQDGTLTWNYGPKKGQPLGLEEFSRRKAAMVKTPGWYDKI